MNNKVIKVNKIIYLIIGIFIISILIPFICSANSNSEYDENKVEIMFTHDLHSHLESYKTDIDGNIINAGGMARLSTVIKKHRAINPGLLLLDGGDTSMGTLYQSLYATHALELSMLGKLGFDATTFGNHDFDYSSELLAEMFNSANANNDYLPAFVISNMDWNTDNKSTKMIYEAASKCNLCNYTVFNKNGVNIAVFGIFGKSAKEDSPTLEINILDQIEASRETVNCIKSNEDVDMIVCISHSGTNSNIKKSEDEQLAMAIPEIDVIISAHTHTELEEPIKINDTYIMSCGCYGLYTGFAAFDKKDNGRWSLSEYENILMNEEIEEDSEILNFLSQYDEIIEENYLDDFGLKFNQIIAYNPYNFESVDTMYHVKGEHILGNFMADAYKYAVNNTINGKEFPADIAVVPSGTIRGTFLEGNVTVNDAFECYSLGLGYDNKVGFPLVQMYLYGKELKLVPEIDATLSDFMDTACLYSSGASYSVNTKRMLLNKAYDIKFNPILLDDSYEEFQDDRLYSIVTDLYTARMLGSVTKVSKGLIIIEPKMYDGSVIPKDDKDYLWENVIVKDDSGNEYKTWMALTNYLMSFEKNEEGISAIPEYYNSTHNRKVINNNFSISNFFYQTNSYFWLISGILLLILLIFILIIFLIIKFLKFINKRKTNI